jgi:membrane fusion protein, heavy metal efflux system
MQMRKTLILAGTCVACAILAFVLWSPAKPHAEEEKDDHHHDDFVHLNEEQCQLYSIERQNASSGILKKVINSPARITIAANQIAHVIPKVSGIALTAYKNLGDQVYENESLAALDSKEMAEAKTTYLASQKKEQLAANKYEREKSLKEKKISAAQDFYDAQMAWEESVIDLELARQKLFALGMDLHELEQLSYASPNRLRLYELRSPIAGNIISRHITIGEFIDTDQRIYVVANLSKVWAEIKLFSQDRPYAKQGQIATVSTHEGLVAQGTIVYLSPIIDEETRTSTAIAEIDNSNRQWLPGSFAQAQLITEEIPVGLIVPRDAIQNIDGTDSVFVATEGGFVVRPITIGRSDEQYCEVNSGLQSGEAFACKNTFLLKAELQKEEAEHMD